MTEYTLHKVRNSNSHPLSVEVRFTGGSLTLMQDWLGTDIVTNLKVSVGERMARSLSVAFQAGMKCVVIIGTDCPGLNASLLAVLSPTTLMT